MLTQSDAESDKEVANFGKLSEGKTRFVFVQPVKGNFDGNPDATFEWLLSASLAAINLSKSVLSLKRAA